ncbi:hypothetical protein, partial [Acetobacter fabarum]|uniref:hypothetical protein n=1 Tax=Acetobacter fabarum TaxID=483199 RepID=UPI0039E8AEE5
KGALAWLMQSLWAFCDSSCHHSKQSAERQQDIPFQFQRLLFITRKHKAELPFSPHCRHKRSRHQLLKPIQNALIVFIINQ